VYQAQRASLAWNYAALYLAATKGLAEKRLRR
jgi:hypothetical protein